MLPGRPRTTPGDGTLYLQRLADRRELRAQARQLRRVERARLLTLREALVQLGLSALEVMRISLLSDPPDVVACLRAWAQLDELPEGAGGPAVDRVIATVSPLPEWALSRVQRLRLPCDDDRPYGGACVDRREYGDLTRRNMHDRRKYSRSRIVGPADDERTKRLATKLALLAEVRFTCPSCQRQELRPRAWRFDKRMRRKPICFRCWMQRYPEKKPPGRPRLGEPPADGVCPRCSVLITKRRKWDLRTRPVVCRRCSTARSEGTIDG